MSKNNEEEEYSIGMQVGLIIGLYALSLVISIIYNIHHFNRQRMSRIILALSILYVSFFVFLNIMAIFDLFFNNRHEFKKLFKFLKKFYFGFTLVDKGLGFFLFSVLIYYLESGYYSNYKKFSDGVIRFLYSIKKLTTKQIIIIISIAVPIIVTLLVLLIKYRKHYNLGNNPLDYTDILFDCYAVFEIYTGVGFFIYQLIKDYKRRKNRNLEERYYRYSTCKIIDKTKKYLKNIDQTYEDLNKLSPVFEKDTTNPYHVYLQKKFNEVKQTKSDLEKNSGNNVVINNNTNESNNTFSVAEINNEKNYVQNLTKPKTQDAQTGTNLESNSNDNQIKPLEEDYKTCKSIRKYKKAVRRIEKLKKLYAEIYVEKNSVEKSSCTFRFIILWIAFGIAIVTDFFLPLVFDYGSDKDYYNDDSDLFDKNQSTAMNIATGIVGMLVAAIIACPYTIITIYSTIRKRYISGDYLYNKQINDHISLMKTVQLVCGYSFSIVYCNLYFWKAIDYKGKLGKPYFYDEIIIPDYIFNQGISIYMLIKIILIVGAIFAHLYLSDVFIFKNDLAEYNLAKDTCIYDNKDEFIKKLNDNYNITRILGINLNQI
jgi:hypothetical protein